MDAQDFIFIISGTAAGNLIALSAFFSISKMCKSDDVSLWTMAGWLAPMAFIAVGFFLAY